MSVGIQLKISSDTASPAVHRVIAGLHPERINPILGEAAVNSVKKNLISLQQSRPNALGAPRTNFFAKAAKATHFRVEGDHVVVSINQVGIALRYFGGTVRPKTKKYLTIPAIPEAHGKRASEFSDLHFSIELNPKLNARMPCLVQGARSLIRTRKVKGLPKVFAAGSVARRVVFWLVRSATFSPDESVLPSQADLQAHLQNTVDSYVKLLVSRASK